MKKVSELVKFLKAPHAKKVQQYKERYQELEDLSEVAIEIGDAAAYKSLQAEMREVFFDYLTTVAVDSIYKFAPHVLIICVISLKWPTITIPIVNWQVGILGAYLVAYLLYFVGKRLLKPIKCRLFDSSSFGIRRASELTKI